MVATERSAKTGAIRSETAGLSASFVVISSGHSAESSHEARQRLAWVSRWLPGYLRAVFGPERRRWHRAAWLALEEDAAQHLVVAVIQRGPKRWSTVTDEHAFNWSKMVVRNFVISETSRRRTRSDALLATLAEGSADSPESRFAFRQSTERLIAVIRSEIPTLIRSRDVPSVLRAFDDLVRHSIAALPANTSEPSQHAARRRQQRRRTRRLVARIAADLCPQIKDTAERAEFFGLVNLLLGEDPTSFPEHWEKDKKVLADVTSRRTSTLHY